MRDRDDVDLVYVNDNYGDFSATREALLRQIVDGARPDRVKPFIFTRRIGRSWPRCATAPLATPLSYLLTQLETKRVVLTGQVTEQCIGYSALDAYVRHYEVIVAFDVVAHLDANLGTAAPRMEEGNMRAEVVPAAHCLG